VPAPSSSEPATARPGSELDPEIAAFRRAAEAASRHLPDLKTLMPEQARAGVEAARTRWRQGGPEMRQITDAAMRDADPALRLRVFEPQSVRPGTLIYLHGGGWTMFSLETHDRIMRELAARAEIRVVGLDYALAPEAQFPVAIRQVAHAIRAVAATPEAFGLQAGPIFAGGDSAGANLAVAAALALRESGAPHLLAGLLLNYGVYDATFDRPSYAAFDDDAYMLTRDEMEFFWRRYIPDEGDRLQGLASPLRAALSGLPPAFMAIAECDVLADENHAMAEKLRASGVPVRSVTYPGTTHSFLEAVSVAAVAGRALQDQADWLRQHADG
jgi:acetyl esterase